MEDKSSREPARDRHLYDDPEKRKELKRGSTTEASIFYNRMYSLWHKQKGNISPYEIIGRFYDAQRKQDLWPIINLHDVWLRATWEADNWILGGPHKINDPGRHAKLDQVAALIEEAMDIAGHRPEEPPAADSSK